jgi:PPOX class probable FMN-dependent enzyme
MSNPAPDFTKHLITEATQLDALYGAPSKPSLSKELDHIAETYRPFIEKSPFCILATSGPDGLDCTPRGDPPGFVHIEDVRTLLLPDRRGNNRLDALRNILENPEVSLIFLIPGVGETLRINGTATISADPALCARFEMQGKTPATVLILSVRKVYFQCQKAIRRSSLWETDAQVERSALPTAGDILAAIDEGFDGKDYDDRYPERMRQTIY